MSTPPQGDSWMFVRTLHRRYILYAAGIVAFVALMAVLERQGLPRPWMGAIFLVATIGTYACIGLLSRTLDEAEYYVAGRRVPAIYNGMATAADWMSAASFIGTAGVLYLQGFAGLAYILGWTGGYCLVAFLLAPYLRRLKQYTVPDFLGARYGGSVPRLLGAVSVILVSFVYVVVQIYGVGLIASHLTGFGFEVGVFVGLGGVLVCSFLGGMRAVTWTQVAQYLVLIVAYLVPVVWLSVSQTGQPAPFLAYGQQLAKVTDLEQRLLNDPAERDVRARLQDRADAASAKLGNVRASLAADARQIEHHLAQLREDGAPLAAIQQAERQLSRLPRTDEEARAQYERVLRDSQERARPLAGMPPQALPFPEGDPAGTPGQREAFDGARLNFLALVLCLMMGTAALPHLLVRFYTTPSVSETRRSVVWALLFIALLYLAAPALAVFVKYEVFNSLVGTPFSELPQWMRSWSKLDPSFVSVEDINGDGILQLAELRLAGDMIVLASPEIGGLPKVVTYLVAAGALAAALSTADGLLLTISNALSHDLYFRVINPNASPIRRVMVSKMMVLVVALMAAVVASLRIADIVQFVSAAFSLAASAFFPALVMGIFWRRANRAGAVAGMCAGLGVCLYYMSTTMPGLRSLFGVTRPLADCRWWGVDPVSAAVFGVPAGVAVLIAVSLLTPRPGPAEEQMLDAVRLPRLGEN